MAVDIKDFLAWWKFNQADPVPFDIVFPTIVNNDETEYNLITGPDSGNLPPWSFVVFYEPIYAIQVANKYAGINFPAVENKVDNMTSGTTAEYVRGDGSLATLPTISVPTINNGVSRSLNSNYTISSTKQARVSYSVNVAWGLAALLSGSGAAFLEFSTNAGSSWTTINQVSKNIGLLTFSGADDLNLVGEIPANALVRIRTTSSNMTVTYTRGQEVLL